MVENIKFLWLRWVINWTIQNYTLRNPERKNIKKKANWYGLYLGWIPRNFEIFIFKPKLSFWRQKWEKILTNWIFELSRNSAWSYNLNINDFLVKLCQNYIHGQHWQQHFIEKDLKSHIIMRVFIILQSILSCLGLFNNFWPKIFKA